MDEALLEKYREEERESDMGSMGSGAVGMAQRSSVYEVGGWEDCETTAGAEDDANILAKTPLLLLTLPPLEVEEPLALLVAGSGCCKTPVGFSGNSD